MSRHDFKATTQPGKRHFDSSKLWAQTARSGVYLNPIICADYSDPDVIRHGEDYYLTASSFNCTPGLPILHSKDLVHWRIVNHAVKNLPAKRYESVQLGCGVWAPAIRFHDGRFWITFPMPDEGIYVTTADDPAGEWSEPHLLQAGKGLIDPCPLWDDDGSAYLVHAYAHSRSGVRNRLQVRPMAPDCSRLLGDGEVVFEDPSRHPVIEGPKFLKKDGWYYVFAPAGGVSTGWQVALRSRSIYGPYEDRVVLEQGATSVNGPHQGAMVDTPNGDWWFIHFQDAGAYGRVTHLQPVAWRNGWPHIGVDRDGNGVGEPVAQHPIGFLSDKKQHFNISTSDDFAGSELGLQWQWNANHREDWYSLDANPGALRLYAGPAPRGKLQHAPHLLLQKFPEQVFTATTSVEVPEGAGSVRAGLVAMGKSYSGLLVRRCDEQIAVERVTCEGLEDSQAEQTVDVALCESGPVWLRVEVGENAVCNWSYSTDGSDFRVLGPPYEATPGVWIGARVGLACVGEEAFADFGSFEVQ